ncbi:MAG: sigma 54-interacting transcriptional regulator [Desulfovermiculus sp.]|nr:sigma 54-interacting transcriptional regulator [Desulfovermiculus sp.]
MATQNHTVLFIDDDKMSRTLIGSFLQDNGYQVHVAPDGREGLELFARYRPEVVLLDLYMPKMDGFEVLEHIRSQDQEAQVLVISGVGDMNDVIRAVRAGASNYVIKSLQNLDLIKDAVDKSIDYLKLTREKRRNQELLLKALEENKFYRIQLESIYDSLPDGILTVDAQGKILRLNHSMRSNCPIGSDLETGTNVSQLEEGNGEYCLRVLERALREKREFINCRIECPYLQDLKKVFLGSAAPMRNDQGEVIGANLIIKDISRQERLEEELENRRQFRNIVGKSRSMQQVYNMIRKLADVDSTVLITGESGTGKECVMEALHYSGNRSNGPLCRVNCSALSEDLLDSELFGHVKGAFTGAHKDKVGRFETAHNGTIFLDEIGEISHRIQLKLLRILETKSFERVGSSKTISVDVRIISATNADLALKVQQGEFREDLYYRLKVLSIHVPPLRERKDDIPLLVDSFCRHFSREFKKEIIGVSEQVMKIFMNYDWPGNVRELKHALEHGCLLSSGGRVFVDDLPLELLEYSKQENREFKQVNLQELTRGDLEQALIQAKGNKVKAAELLGIHRKTLYRKIHQLGIPLSSY